MLVILRPLSRTSRIMLCDCTRYGKNALLKNVSYYYPGCSAALPDMERLRKAAPLAYAISRRNFSWTSLFISGSSSK